MATPFSDNEKELIREKLKEVACDCLLKYGVRKTTVDQIVQMAGISKGSFYKFYETKEILFFTILEEYQKSIMDELINKLKGVQDIGVEKFTDLIYELYEKVRQSFIINILKNNEFEYLMRKLPRELIINHHSFDDMLAEEIFSYIKIKDGIKKDIITASLRAIFMSMLHIEEIGAKDFDEVLKLLIRGLAIQLFNNGTCY